VIEVVAVRETFLLEDPVSAYCDLFVSDNGFGGRRWSTSPDEAWAGLTSSCWLASSRHQDPFLKLPDTIGRPRKAQPRS
jgi:hypothetical protein